MTPRQISSDEISEIVSQLCVEANYCLGDNVTTALQRAQTEEVSPLGRMMLERLWENAQMAQKEGIPLCQDTRLTVVFTQVGQETHVAAREPWEQKRRECTFL